MMKAFLVLFLFFCVLFFYVCRVMSGHDVSQTAVSVHGMDAPLDIEHLVATWYLSTGIRSGLVCADRLQVWETERREMQFRDLYALYHVSVERGFAFIHADQARVFDDRFFHFSGHVQLILKNMHAFPIQLTRHRLCDFLATMRVFK